MKLSVSELNMSFKSHHVLRDVSFEFESGKIYALLGRNGSGKTTFFNCLAGELKPQSMQASLETDGIVEKLHRDDIGFVVSTPNVPGFLTGREFLEFMLEIHGNYNTPHEITRAVDEYFEYLDIEVHDRDKLMKDYSHGMKNKMQMIVNIITHPKVLFLDEPLTTLDVVMAEKMKDLIRSLREEYIIIFSTHIMELALDLCDEIVLLHNGKMDLLDVDTLDQKDQKERIIQALTDGDHHEKE